MKAFENVEKLFSVKHKSFHFDELMRADPYVVALLLSTLLNTVAENIV
jgi:hypothetical protein